MHFSIETWDDEDGDTVLFKISENDVVLELLAEVLIDDRGCLLRNAPIQGGGANSVGVARLLRLARQLKEKLGVEELRIEGATRTSGAGPGHRPRPLVFR